jgi:hypothetical protein
VAEDVYGFDRARAERLKAIADHPKIINRLNLPRQRQPTGGGTTVTYAFPPSTGIPAATYNFTTKTLTPGTAMCKLAIQLSAGVYKEGTESELVENPITSAVATNGKPITIAMTSFGRYEIIVEDCTSGGTGSNTNPDNPLPVPSPDPISEGNNSISLGYIVGV